MLQTIASNNIGEIEASVCVPTHGSKESALGGSGKPYKNQLGYLKLHEK